MHRGMISYRNRRYRVGKAVQGLPVAIRSSTVADGCDVYFCRQLIRHLDLQQPGSNARYGVSYVPEHL